MDDDDRTSLVSAYLAHREAIRRWLIDKKRAAPDVADEVIQTLYMRIRHCPLPKEGECITKWLHNKAFSLLRHRHRSEGRRENRQAKTGMEQRPPTPEEVEDMRSLGRRLFSARSELSTLERQVFRLKARGWPASNVAERLGCSVAAVYAAHQRAVTKLRRIAREHVMYRLVLPPWLVHRSRRGACTWSIKGLASPWIIIGGFTALVGMLLVEQNPSKALDRHVVNDATGPATVERPSRSESEEAIGAVPAGTPQAVEGTRSDVPDRECIHEDESRWGNPSREAKVPNGKVIHADDEPVIPRNSPNPSEPSPPSEPEPEPAAMENQLGVEAQMLGVVTRFVTESRWKEAKQALDEYERRFPGEREMKKTFETLASKVAAGS